MIAMCIVNWIVFTFTHVRSKRLPMIVIRRLIIRRSILIDKFFYKGIGAGSIIRCVRSKDDILVVAIRESFYIPHFIDVLFREFALFHRLFLAFSSLNNNAECCGVFTFGIGRNNVVQLCFECRFIQRRQFIQLLNEIFHFNDYRLIVLE